MHVDQAGLWLLMSEQLLQIRRGIPLHCFIRRAGVAKRMATEFLADPGKFAVLLNNIHHAAHGKMASLIVEKYMLVYVLWPRCKVGSECLRGLLLKVYRALLVALAVDKH